MSAKPKTTNSKEQEILDAKFFKGEIKNLYISEILEKISAIKSINNKIEALRNNASIPLMNYLYYVYESTIKFNLNENEVKKITYNKQDCTDLDMSINTIRNESDRFNVLINKKINKKQMSDFLERWFETFHNNDVQLMYMMYAHKISAPYNGITEKLVRSAYPNLLSVKKREYNFAPKATE